MLDWDHNAYYHRLLLREIPTRCHRALDVGCGAGSFASRLAQHVEQVDAIDRSAVMVEIARNRNPDNVNCILADAMTHPLTEGYDAIFSICALHHMNLEAALPRFAALLRPGGVLAIVALPRKDLRHELPAEVVAALGHRALGAVFATARSIGRKNWFAKDSSHSAMPVVLSPDLMTRQVAERAAEVLPGVRVRRLIFWRFLMVWKKPA